MSIDGRVFNTLFITKLDSPEGTKEAREIGAAYIREKIREEGFLGKIIPPERVTQADTQRSAFHDSLVKIVDVEPDSTAVELTFRGEPRINYIEGPRAEVRFYSIHSERFEKTEQELRAYEYPVKKVIERNVVRDIQQVEDSRLILYSDAISRAASIHAEVKASLPVVRRVKRVRFAIASPDVQILNKIAITSGCQLLDVDKLHCEQFLISDFDYDSFLSNDNTEFGDQLLGEIEKDGYTYNTILGRRVISTNKTELVKPGFQYFYTSPEFLGKFYTFNDVQFYVDKRANLITFEAWEDIAVSIINSHACARSEISSISQNALATPESQDGVNPVSPANPAVEFLVA